MTPLYLEQVVSQRQARDYASGTLTWKCMWSTIRKPGWRSKLAEMTSCVASSSAVRLNLEIAGQTQVRILQRERE